MLSNQSIDERVRLIETLVSEKMVEARRIMQQDLRPFEKEALFLRSLASAEMEEVRQVVGRSGLSEDKRERILTCFAEAYRVVESPRAGTVPNGGIADNALDDIRKILQQSQAKDAGDLPNALQDKVDMLTMLALKKMILYSLVNLQRELDRNENHIYSINLEQLHEFGTYLNEQKLRGGNYFADALAEMREPLPNLVSEKIGGEEIDYIEKLFNRLTAVGGTVATEWMTDLEKSKVMAKRLNVRAKELNPELKKFHESFLGRTPGVHPAANDK